MRRLILHVGYAKSASTSLQAALIRSDGVIYPHAGRHGTEHIALPLELKGMDDWTAQFLTPVWARREAAALLAEIRAHSNPRGLPFAISSERLIDLDDTARQTLADALAGFDVEVVVLRRPREDYLRSTWCHLVFYDFAESWESFSARGAQMSMTAPLDRWRSRYPVHDIEMAEPGWQERLSALYGTRLELRHDNVGVGFEVAQRLQQIHADLGTEAFQSFFTPERKRAFVALYAARETTPAIAPLSDPSALFGVRAA